MYNTFTIEFQPDDYDPLLITGIGPVRALPGKNGSRRYITTNEDAFYEWCRVLTNAKRLFKVVRA